MNKKVVSGIILTLLLIGMLTLTFNIQTVKASGNVYIRADGSIDPPTAPIQRDGDIYAFKDSIYDSFVDKMEKYEKGNIYGVSCDFAILSDCSKSYDTVC